MQRSAKDGKRFVEKHYLCIVKVAKDPKKTDTRTNIINH